ncbi:AbrB/MazE/SpoVT family DNA-binding domain-containing protein [Halobaculum sp. P14]|uniref:AbrB/MazE/SpoVT family DNA-binding domain-containing protein n=1 Tax=Halobaculum sp. P14 TaxID=3421638 RepID=UPI003EC06F35
MSGISRLFADTRTVQEHNGSVTVTIPSKIVDELGIEDGDELPWVCEEGSNTAEVRTPGDP